MLTMHFSWQAVFGTLILAMLNEVRSACTSRDVIVPELMKVLFLKEQEFVVLGCVEGYTLTSQTSGIVWCSGGSWDNISTVPCTPVDCGTPDFPPHGFCNWTSTLYKGRAICACSKDYRLFGDSVRICQADGFWGGSLIACIMRETSTSAPRTVSSEQTSTSTDVRLETTSLYPVTLKTSSIKNKISRTPQVRTFKTSASGFSEHSTETSKDRNLGSTALPSLPPDQDRSSLTASSASGFGGHPPSSPRENAATSLMVKTSVTTPTSELTRHENVKVTHSADQVKTKPFSREIQTLTNPDRLGQTTQTFMSLSGSGIQETDATFTPGSTAIGSTMERFKTFSRTEQNVMTPFVSKGVNGVISSSVRYSLEVRTADPRGDTPTTAGKSKDQPALAVAIVVPLVLTGGLLLLAVAVFVVFRRRGVGDPKDETRSTGTLITEDDATYATISRSLTKPMMESSTRSHTSCLYNVTYKSLPKHHYPTKTKLAPECNPSKNSDGQSEGSVSVTFVKANAASGTTASHALTSNGGDYITMEGLSTNTNDYVPRALRINLTDDYNAFPHVIV